MKVKFLEVGEVQPNILDLIVKDLNKRFKSKFFSGGKIKIPENAYDKFKNQYNAEIILNVLKEHKGDSDKVIGVTSKDCYAGELNFVFGLSREDTGMVSTARLDPQFYGESANFEIIIKRTLKEIIHQIGNMFGIKQCNNPDCIMSFPRSISYVDDKKIDFCKDCTLKISMEGIEI